MSDLINNVYLPDFKKRSVRESDAYKLLSENKKIHLFLKDMKIIQMLEL